ncbi:dihydroorotase [Dethiobacter alkaliphilus]|uniref:dihydroorotase n=1 Tax=Dethiobacter alkaliphilus TaxID=427926 RepID=UPI002227938A|nr:dihydroorotase [Dethiobacter alkaliphilus]MCW3491405.1 dihydroorotase [Dethiobacter alkaliphilus]
MNGLEMVIRGGTVVDPSQNIDGIFDVLVAEGKIARIAQNIEAEGRQIIDAAGKVVVPGFIDLHTHLRQPGGEAKETVLTGSRAAAAGGYTGITALPNTRPVIDNAQMVARQNELAAKANLVRVWPVGAVTKGSEGSELAEIGGMVKQGARAITDDGRGVPDARLLRNAMLYCRELDIPLFEHCEEEALAGNGQLHEGVVSARLGLQGMPAAAETVMLARDLVLAKETGCRIHIMHVSCAETVEMIRKAKKEGIPVTAEVTPHHLLLTDEAVEGYNTNAKMKPPLRTAEDVAAVRMGLADGTIDAVGTDHAPHTESEKGNDFISAPFGIVGLETAFPLLYTHLVRPGVISLSQLVERMSWRPAAILGVPHGTLKPGGAADLAIIDTQQEQIIEKERFYSKGKNTPFDRWPVTGIPVLTMVAGTVVMRDGKVE